MGSGRIARAIDGRKTEAMGLSRLRGSTGAPLPPTMLRPGRRADIEVDCCRLEINTDADGVDW
jgi:hypothetical protein